MAETVIITGRDLGVEHRPGDDSSARFANVDPKRLRPPRFAASPDANVLSPSGWTLDEMIDMPNPFWPEEG